MDPQESIDGDNDGHRYGFLTKTQQQVVSGEYEGSDNALSIQKSRIKKSARFALAHLHLVLRNEMWDNDEILQPKDIESLVEAAIGEPEEIEPFWEAFEDDEARREYPEKYRYERAMAESINRLDSLYYKRLTSPTPPPEFNAPSVDE